MNVDEAMKIAKARPITAGKWEMAEVADILAEEVERLRAWNIRWRDVSAKLRLTLAELSEELAAAKAASVLPTEVIGCYSFGPDVKVMCECADDSDRLSGWLRDRMKDTTPPQPKSGGSFTGNS